jgi:hypothetical protein
MPRETFLDALGDLGECPAEGADPRAEQLAALFGVPWPTVIQRLVDLGLPPVGSGESISGPTEESVAAAAGVAGSVTETTKAGEPAGQLAGEPAGQQAGPSPGQQAGQSAEEPSFSLTLPERFVNLALAAYAGHVLDVEDLARFLRTTPPEALQMADIAGVAPEWRDGWG